MNIDSDFNAVELPDETTDAIHLYPFPIKGPEIMKAELQEESRILVTTRYARSDSRLAFFLLDPKTGLYQHTYVPTVCEGRVLQAAPGEGAWTIVDRRNYYRSEDMFLCQTETGQMRQPKGINLEDMGLLATPNPNRILMQQYNTTDYPMFMYDAEQDLVVSLGTVSRQLDNEVSICDWFTDTKGILCTEDGYGRDYIGRGYYEFDMMQENSIQPLFMGWSGTISSLSNPKRYFSVYDAQYTGHQIGTAIDSYACVLSIYDAAGLRDHFLGNVCIPRLTWQYGSSLFFWHGDHLYYLTTKAQQKASSLHYYDLETDQISEPLLSGEVESIISVSPDERYIALVLDDNGRLDFAWDSEYCCANPMPLGILDTQTGDIVYRSEPMGIYYASQVQWIDDATAIVAVSESYRSSRYDRESLETPASTRRINLGETDVTESITTDYHCEYEVMGYPSNLAGTLSPDNHYCIADSRFLLDLETFEDIPIMNAAALDAYRVSLGWDTDGILTATVTTHDNWERSITYLVTLP
jgi:hypothetical protein